MVKANILSTLPEGCGIHIPARAKYIWMDSRWKGKQRRYAWSEQCMPRNPRIHTCETGDHEAAICMDCAVRLGIKW